MPVVVTTQQITQKEASPNPSSRRGTDAPKADYIYVGKEMPEHPEPGQDYILDFDAYMQLSQSPFPTGEGRGEAGESTACFPIFPVTAMPFVGMVQASLKFLVLEFGTPAEEYLACLKSHPEVVVVCMGNHQNRLGEQRALVHEMMNAGVNNPVKIGRAHV